MNPANGSGHRLGMAHKPRFRLDGGTIGIGVVLAALGICCVTTLAATGLGVAAIVTAAAAVAGLGWLAPLMAIVGLVGIVWFQVRRRRGAMASAGPGANGRVRSGSERADSSAPPTPAPDSGPTSHPAARPA